MILNYYPEFNSKDFTEENIFKAVFKKEKYDYFKIKNIISDIYQLSELFLKTISTLNISFENDIVLLNALHERDLDSVYLKREKQLDVKMKNSLRDESYFYSKYLLAKINTSHFKFEKTGYQFGQIQNEFDAFLDYSLTGLLRLYSKMLHNKNHGNVNFNMEMFENVLEYIKDKDFEDNPSNKIYKTIILLELSKDEKYYRELLSLKEKFESVISNEDMYYILLIINSFSVYKLKLGDESYYRDRFLSFKEIIDRKFIPDNYFLFVNFISTFTSACMAGEIEWAENFLADHQKGISPKEETFNTVNYCKGFLEYRKRNYDCALEYFAKTNFKLFLVKVMVKSYSIRIFYEQDMYEQTISAIDTFRHYLKSENQISEDLKTAQYEFLRFLSELTRLKIDNIKNNNDPRLIVLRKEIENMSSNPLGAKNWLIEKANNFI
ncbi:MAG: hypothetical protein WAT71_17650 [Ignavibacteria bacterium]